jgi:hypothetical protein
VSQITILRGRCPICGSTEVRSDFRTKEHGRLFVCQNLDHPHWVLLDDEVVSLRDRARDHGYQAMFYYTLDNSHFQISGRPGAFNGAPPVVVRPWTTRTYTLDQARAAAKAVLLVSGLSSPGLDDVTHAVIKVMRTFGLLKSDYRDCAAMIRSVCRELGLVNAGWLVVSNSARWLPKKPETPQAARSPQRRAS